MRSLPTIVPLSLLLSWLAGCALFIAVGAGCQPTAGMVQSSAPAARLHHTAIDSQVISRAALSSEGLVRQFYRSVHWQAVWMANGSLSAAADSLVALLESAPLYGLDSKRYRPDEIKQLMAFSGAFYLAPTSVVTTCDLLLTDAYFTMALDLRRGRVRHNTLPEADAKALVSTLSGALDSHGIRLTLEAQEPCHPQYLLLKEELHRLLKLGGRLAAAEKLQTLRSNIDRWRQEAEMFPARYILVNIPAYQLYVVEDQDTVLESRAIVGAVATPTPVLQSTIWCFTIYPYWNVPRSITGREILPRVQADTGYLRRNFYDVLDARGNEVAVADIDWQRYNAGNFPYFIRQREGEENALGVVKFRFDNPYGVYLHDTNARALFRKSARALSHGCIRMEKARELAAYLVRYDSVYSNPAALNHYFDNRIRTEVSVLQPIPILVRYLTAVATGDRVIYYEDVYGKDKPYSKMNF